MKLPFNSERGLTIKELKEIVKDLPDTDEDGDDYEVWIMTSDGLSNIVKSVYTLNRGDIIFGKDF